MSAANHTAARAARTGRGLQSPIARWLVIGLALAGLATAAVVEGLRSNRWGETEDMRAAATKLNGVPVAFGDWTSDENPLDPKVLRVAEANGHVSRTYTNRKTSVRVSVLLLCGPSGPIGAHTPDVCYGGNGYETRGDPVKKMLTWPDGRTASYWSVAFEKKPPTDPPLRVCWMWGVDGDWSASENPRTEFVHRNALYKLYVVRPEPFGPTPLPGPDPIHEFLQEFLPEVRKALAN